MPPATPGQRLKQEREKHGYRTAKAAAQVMGVPIATYTQHEQADRFLPARRAAEYARFYGTTPEYLLYGRTGAIQDRVPVFNKYGVQTNHSAILPPQPTGLTLAQQATEGDGIAHFGMVALYDVPQSRNVPPDVDGTLCVVMPAEGEHQGERLIRIVRKGSRPDRFHLLQAGGGLPLVDVELQWIAPVIALVPSSKS